MVEDSPSRVLGPIRRQAKIKQRRRSASPPGEPPQNPGVKEVTPGVFLYTTRVVDGNSALFFVYEASGSPWTTGWTSRYLLLSHKTTPLACWCLCLRLEFTPGSS
ncbi:unnamed protein product [Discosporangium mesarthrocarpum]